MQGNCGSCHSADYVVTQPQGPAFKKAFWEAEVTKMIKVYGAPIDEADVPKIVDYLSPGLLTRLTGQWPSPISPTRVQRQEEPQQFLAQRREAVARSSSSSTSLAVRSSASLELTMVGLAPIASCSSRKRSGSVAQLPDDPQRPAPPQQVEQRHDRPAAFRAAGRPGAAFTIYFTPLLHFL